MSRYRLLAWVIIGAVCALGSGCSDTVDDSEGDAGSRISIDAAVDAGEDARFSRDAVDSTGDDVGEPSGDASDVSPSDAGDAADTADAADADVGPASECGDDAVEGDEACDDGNVDDGDYCSADCTSVTGSCGDGTLQANESCDDGQIASGCDTKHDGGDGTCLPRGECSPDFVVGASGECVAEQLDQHVHIYVDNFCNLSVDPTELYVPRGQSADLSYHNHSQDYEIDVWASYGGGYLELARGDTWDEQYVHCTQGARPYTEYLDISIAGLGVNDSSCPGHRLMLHCE